MVLLAVGIGNLSAWAAGQNAEPPVGQASEDALSDPGNNQGNMSAMFRGTVLEVIDAGRYVYIQVETGEKKVWVAAPAFDGDIGDEVLVPPGVPVADFQSRKLGRTFDMIYFVGGIRRVGQSDTEFPPNEMSGNQMMHPPLDELAGTPAIEIGEIEKAEGGQTVSEIITGRNELVGHEILLRARVVRVVPNIMGKNWLHVRDGSGSEGSNDLNVTTDAKVKAGDLVLIRGRVSVDRDYGFGFKYDVIIEDAEVTSE